MEKPDFVRKLNKALYGLKQEPRACLVPAYQELSGPSSVPRRSILIA
jgi:hypothetical protein